MRGASLLLGTAAVLAAALATSAAGSSVKPTIGRPAATPAQPQAGSSFKVAFHVANAKSVSFSVSLGGKAQRHSDSFHGGIARTTIALPVTAGGKSLRVTVTASSGGGTSTKGVTYVVRAQTPPSVSIAGVSAAEGNSGTTPFTFAVTLSHASGAVVTVKYGTVNGSATAPSDYAATSGTLTFNPGETSKTIVVSVVGDTVLEADETFFVSLADAVNATIAGGNGSGTITNDDTAAPVAAGYWQGTTQDGEYLYFTVNSDRTITNFRANNLSENCAQGGELQGAIDWGSTAFPIQNDGTFVYAEDWTGSQTYGKLTLTSETAKLSGTFTSATSISGTVSLSDNGTYEGNALNCSASVTYTAAKVG